MEAGPHEASHDETRAIEKAIDEFREGATLVKTLWNWLRSLVRWVDEPLTAPVLLAADDSPRPDPLANDDLHMIVIVKGEERYVFMFTPAKRDMALRQIGAWASNPELSFSWYDAAIVSQRVRAATEPACSGK